MGRWKGLATPRPGDRAGLETRTPSCQAGEGAGKGPGWGSPWLRPSPRASWDGTGVQGPPAPLSGSGPCQGPSEWHRTGGGGPLGVRGGEVPLRKQPNREKPEEAMCHGSGAPSSSHCFPQAFSPQPPESSRHSADWEPPPLHAVTWSPQTRSCVPACGQSPQLASPSWYRTKDQKASAGGAAQARPSGGGRRKTGRWAWPHMLPEPGPRPFSVLAPQLAWHLPLPAQGPSDLLPTLPGCPKR